MKPGFEEELADKRVVVVAPTKREVASLSAALRKSGAEVDLVASLQQAPPLLMGRDVDALVLGLSSIDDGALVFLREAERLWPWLAVVVVAHRIPSEMRRRLARIGVTRFVAQVDDYCAILAELRQCLSEKMPNFLAKESFEPVDFQCQLRILRQVTEPALQASTFSEALAKLVEGLGKWIPASVVAILGVENDRACLVFRMYEEVAPQFVKDVEKTLTMRYQCLSNTRLAIPPTIFQEGVEPVADGAMSVGTSFSVPIVAGGKLDGMLLVAASDERSYNDYTINFIYHAANHFSTVFAALAQVRKLASRDPMTGLFNRYYLEREYLAIANLCKRYPRSMAVVIIDIDLFKSVNDTYGHLVGDEVLREFAGVLKAVTCEKDIVGRYGGEEFVVLLSKGERADALAYAERLRDVIRERVFCAGDYDLRLTVSMGIAYGNPLAEKEAEDFPLLIKADTAVYEAKRAGRDRIRFWSESLLPKKTRAKPTSEEFIQLAEKKKEARILLVDDEKNVRDVICKGLRMEGYDCVAAENGAAALKILENAAYAYDLVITDMVMQGMSGNELIARVGQINDSILCLAISGKATVESAVASLRHGAYDFIEKPLRMQQLYATVKRALDYRTALLENRRYQERLSEMVQQKSARLDESLEEIRMSYEFTLESLVGLLDAREKDFGQHSKRVRNLSVLLARKMGLTESEVETVAQGALLHDIGKIGVPDSILLKKRALTEEEWHIMRQHTETCYRILVASPYLREVSQIVRSHHERYDGKGYPDGLSGRKICLGARIFAVVDAYDAMRSTRNYRLAQNADEALAEIERGSGTQFDPEVVAIFTACHPQIEQLLLEM